MNEAQSSDVKTTVQNISKIQELLINSDVELLEEFLDDMLGFAQRNNQEIKKGVIGFIEEVW